MTTGLDADFVSRFARGPSQTTTERAISAHTSIRDLLGDGDYATLLQGSYKNDTALADMNDVDIVAVHQNTKSSTYPQRITPQNPVTWDEIFSRIERKLNASQDYKGKWTREDKCIRVNTGIKVDIVPAVHTGDAKSDPIAIYSFRSQSERLNYPRLHYDRSAEKSGRTNGNYKQAVRLLKRWVRCWFPNKDEKVAPSYYVECLLYFLPDSVFKGDLAATFHGIINSVAQLSYSNTSVTRIAGGDKVFTEAEWPAAKYAKFQQQLRAVLPEVRKAQESSVQSTARHHWVRAFNGYTG